MLDRITRDAVEFVYAKPAFRYHRHDGDAGQSDQPRLFGCSREIARRPVSDHDDDVRQICSVPSSHDEDLLAGESEGVGKVRSPGRSVGDVVDGPLQVEACVVGVEVEPDNGLVRVRDDGYVALIIGDVDVVDDSLDEIVLHLVEVSLANVRRGIDQEDNVRVPVAG